jgi:hypothetical protein
VTKKTEGFTPVFIFSFLSAKKSFILGELALFVAFWKCNLTRSRTAEVLREDLHARKAALLARIALGDEERKTKMGSERVLILKNESAPRF